MKYSTSLAALLFALAVASETYAQEPVTIDWDEWSVAHVQATDLGSAGYGLGWAQMESRGQTIAAAYLASRGEAAACMGEAMLASDVRVHQLGVPERARSWLAEQDPDSAALLSGFADGANAWLEAHPSREGPLACLTSVTPADPLALLQMTLHVAVVAYGSEQLISGWRDPRGSNAYAVAPSRTADGRTLLLINPHSPWSAPYLSYETHLVTPELNIYGQTFPGLPLPFAGFTDDHGWAFTFNDIDGMDAYSLQRTEGGYRFGDTVLPFRSHDVAISVRGADGVMSEQRIMVLESVHGPVIAETEDRALAMRIAGLDKPNLFGQLLAMWRADDVDAFRAALAQQQLPITNTIYADADGVVGYVFNGLSPVRTTGDRAIWSGILDGSDPALLTDGYLPIERLPQVFAPTSGFVQNANDGPSSATWPIGQTGPNDPLVTADARTPRGRRSLRQMEASSDLTLDTLDDLRRSTIMDAAERSRAPLARAALASHDAETRALGAILDAWDGSTSIDSRGSALFADWAFRMRRAGLDLNAVPISQQSPLESEAALADENRALAELKASGTQLTRLFGSADVEWGRAYRIRRAGLDLPSPVGRDELGAYNAGRYRRISEGPEQGLFVLEDASHFIAEVAFGPDGPQAQGLLSYGNSDDEDAPGVRTQLQMFSRGETRPMNFSVDDISANSVRRETLFPDSKQANPTLATE